MNFTYINNAFATQRMLNMNCMLSTKHNLYENDDSEFCRWLYRNCSFAYFGASSICAATAAAFIRSFKRTEKQFVSIKKLETLHKLHIREREAFMHKEGKVFNNSIFDIFWALSQKAHETNKRSLK